jgi:hypothetical protein
VGLELTLSHAVFSVARSLSFLPQVRCCIYTGPLLGHSLDHVQEKKPLGLVLATVLEPFLYFLERKERAFM